MWPGFGPNAMLLSGWFSLKNNQYLTDHLFILEKCQLKLDTINLVMTAE